MTWPVDMALELAAHGLSVFPCHAVLPNSGGCTCGDEHCAAPGRHSVIREGLLHATTDTAIIRDWWSHWPRATVAIRSGDTFVIADDWDALHRSA